jgi:hypothetical protein
MGKPNGSPCRIMVKIVQRVRKRMVRRSQKMKAQNQKGKMKIIMKLSLVKVTTTKLSNQWRTSRS